MNFLNENDFRTLVAVADAGGNIMQQYDPRYQALVNSLLQQEKGVLLASLLDALRRLKKSGEQEMAERNAYIARLEMTLKQKESDSMALQAQVQTLHNEVTQFRSLIQQQWQQPGFALSPGIYPQSPLSAPGSPYISPLNIADLGRQVLVHSYSLSH